MSKIINVKIDPMGNATVEADGFQGQGCEDATSAIEKALAGGSGKVERTYKDEWHESEDAETQNHEHNW